jgi:hypothetical protein
MGRDSSVGIATRYGLDGPGIESRWGGEIFLTRTDRLWGSPSLLHNAYRIPFPGVKRPERGVDNPPPSSTEVKERVKLYLYSPSGPSWPVIFWTYLYNPLERYMCVSVYIVYSILYFPLYFVSLRMAPSEPKRVGDNTTYCIMNYSVVFYLKTVK